VLTSIAVWAQADETGAHAWDGIGAINTGQAAPPTRASLKFERWLAMPSRDATLLCSHGLLSTLVELRRNAWSFKLVPGARLWCVSVQSAVERLTVERLRWAGGPPDVTPHGYPLATKRSRGHFSRPRLGLWLQPGKAAVEARVGSEILHCSATSGTRRAP